LIIISAVLSAEIFNTEKPDYSLLFKEKLINSYNIFCIKNYFTLKIFFV